MQFLSDVQIPVKPVGEDVSMLRRYKFFSKENIFDVLKMTVDEAAEFFEAQPKIHSFWKPCSRWDGICQIGTTFHHPFRRRGAKDQTCRGTRKKSTGKTLYQLMNRYRSSFHDIRLLLNCLNHWWNRATQFWSLSITRCLKDGRPYPRTRAWRWCKWWRWSAVVPEKLAEEKTLTGKF